MKLVFLFLFLSCISISKCTFFGGYKSPIQKTQPASTSPLQKTQSISPISKLLPFKKPSIFPRSLFALKRLHQNYKTEKFIPVSCGLKVNPCVGDLKYRRLDGSCNNLKVPTHGVVNSTFVRLLPSKYSDGIQAIRKGFNNDELPSVRLLRTSLFPAGEKSNQQFTLNDMQFGQFIAHDMSFLKLPDGETCCTGDGKMANPMGVFCLPITIPKSDPTIGQTGVECVDFMRAVTDKDLLCSKDPKRPIEQLNVVTSYMDLSLVYDLSNDLCKPLRAFSRGLMKTDTRNGVEYMPPSNFPCSCSKAGDSECYRAGDVRANSNPHLTLIHTLFVREHNRIAKELASVNPHWNDETLFQEARRINIAAYQHIAYYEWLPTLLGRDFMINKKIIHPDCGTFVNDYNPSLNPGVFDAHAQAAFRFSHTAIAGKLNLYNEERSLQSTVSINKFWLRPQILGADTIRQLTMGLVTQGLEDNDDIHADAVVDQMFNCEESGFGFDLKAFDFQRDRDFGLAGYNDYRKYCGLKVATCFDDYTDLIPQEKVNILKKVYKDFRDVDLSVGGTLENLAENAQVGPTFRCIIGEQFLRTRQSDRYWYENSGCGFTDAQLAEIRKASMSRIFCNNGDGIKDMQSDAFRMICDGSNSVTACENIPTMDLSQWKEN